MKRLLGILVLLGILAGTGNGWLMKTEVEANDNIKKYRVVGITVSKDNNSERIDILYQAGSNLRLYSANEKKIPVNGKLTKKAMDSGKVYVQIQKQNEHSSLDSSHLMGLVVE